MDRFKQKIDTDGDCWLWLAGVDKDGYGKVKIGGRDLRTHRVAWEIANCRKVPDELVVMRSCDVPGCCNPAHLRVGTIAQNNQDREIKNRGRYRNMTHCPNGHEYSPENLVHNSKYRRCLICRRRTMREASARYRIKRLAS